MWYWACLIIIHNYDTYNTHVVLGLSNYHP